MNCGVCTAVCPAAEFYNYDPRQIVDTVQSGDDRKIEELLAGEQIWYCGECMSCKPRCPRGNTPGYIIQALRTLSQQTGLFVNSEKGRQQLVIKRTVGQNIFDLGYCIHPTRIDPEKHPEQGPVWAWINSRPKDVFDRFGDGYDSGNPGAMRRIDDKSLRDSPDIRRNGRFRLFRTDRKILGRKRRPNGDDGNRKREGKSLGRIRRHGLYRQ